MLDKDTIEVLDEESLGFYSHCLLVKKVSRGWRPIITLFPLNGVIQQTIRDGNSILASEFYQGGQLHDSSRPDGCVVPGTHSLCFLEVLMSAKWSYINSKFYTLICQQHFRYSLRCSEWSQLCSYAEYTPSALYRWLVDLSQLQGSTCQRFE